LFEVVGAFGGVGVIVVEELSFAIGRK